MIARSQQGWDDDDAWIISDAILDLRLRLVEASVYYLERHLRNMVDMAVCDEHCPYRFPEHLAPVFTDDEQERLFYHLADSTTLEDLRLMALAEERAFGIREDEMEDQKAERVADAILSRVFERLPTIYNRLYDYMLYWGDYEGRPDDLSPPSLDWNHGNTRSR